MVVAACASSLVGGCGGRSAPRQSQGATSVPAPTDPSSNVAAAGQPTTTVSVSVPTTGPGQVTSTRRPRPPLVADASGAIHDVEAAMTLVQPRGWIIVPTDAEGLRRSVAELRSSGRAAAADLADRLAPTVTSGVGSRLFVVRPDGAAAFVVNVTLVPTSVEKAIDDSLDQLRAQGGDGRREAATLAGVNGFRVVQQVPPALAGGFPSSTAVQWWLPTARGVVVLILAGEDPALAGVATSLRFD